MLVGDYGKYDYRGGSYALVFQERYIGIKKQGLFQEMELTHWITLGVQ